MTAPRDVTFQYRGCPLRGANDGGGFVCGVHDLAVLAGLHMGGEAQGALAACAALRDRLHDSKDPLHDVIGVGRHRTRVPKRLPLWLQAILADAQSTNVDARIALAGAPATVPAVLARLLRDDVGWVRAKVALRRDGSENLLPTSERHKLLLTACCTIIHSPGMVRAILGSGCDAQAWRIIRATEMSWREMHQEMATYPRVSVGRPFTPSPVEPVGSGLTR